MSNKLDISDWYTGVSSARGDRSLITSSSMDLHKSKMKNEPADRAPKTLFTDPLTLNYAMGYKNRREVLSDETMRSISGRLSIVAAILQTRCNQISSFSSPYRQTKSLGYMIKHKDPSHPTTEGELEFIKSMEDFIYNCGKPEENPYTTRRRDDFETFLRKFVRDSLTFDRACAEIVPDRLGKPYEFLAVDSATIKLAMPTGGLIGPNISWIEREGSGGTKSAPYNKFQDLYSYDPDRPPAYIQVVNGQIQNVYYHDELIFGVRNPRSDIYVQGYGYSELEQLVTIVTSLLNAEEYNRNIFINGSQARGILNIKGENYSPEMLETFKRQWKANLEGAANSHKTAILQSEQGIDWINLNPNNRDMEYGQWVEWLLKIACAVFAIDPAELNFDMKGGVQQTPLFESSQEWKLKASRDRGLKPLLKFVTKMINKQIIEPIDDRFVFDFVGLDELTEQEKHELQKEQLGSYKTLNEIRRAEDLDDVEFGDLPLNPVYIQMRAQMAQEEQQKQMQQAQPPGGAPPGAPGAAPGGAPAPGGPAPDPASQGTTSRMPYVDNFGKSLDANIDDWITYARK